MIKRNPLQSSCQGKVKISGFLPSKNVRFLATQKFPVLYHAKNV